jgi:hypothetical protein
MAPGNSDKVHFPPNTGRTVGYLGLALAVAVIAVSYYYVPTREWITLSVGCVAGGIAVWIILLRPRAYATGESLVLVNMVSNTWIPLAAIERVEPRHALIVWVNGKKHLCVGIAKSRRVATGRARSRVSKARGGIESRAGWMTPTDTRLATGYEQGHYEDFVVSRIEQLAKDAVDQGMQPGPVRRVPAPLEIGLLLASLGGLALAFLY